MARHGSRQICASFSVCLSSLQPSGLDCFSFPRMPWKCISEPTIGQASSYRPLQPIVSLFARHLLTDFCTLGWIYLGHAHQHHECGQVADLELDGDGPRPCDADWQRQHRPCSFQQVGVGRKKCGVCCRSGFFAGYGCFRSGFFAGYGSTVLVPFNR